MQKLYIQCCLDFRLIPLIQHFLLHLLHPDCHLLGLGLGMGQMHQFHQQQRHHHPYHHPVSTLSMEYLDYY